jgi:hypothetical protein
MMRTSPRASLALLCDLADVFFVHFMMLFLFWVIQNLRCCSIITLREALRVLTLLSIALSRATTGATKRAAHSKTCV